MIKLHKNIMQYFLANDKLNTVATVIICLISTLQISACNELNKSETLETKILKELRYDLKQNLSEIESNIEYMSNSNRANEIIFNHMENNLPYHDSLDYHFAFLYPYTTFSPNKTTFDYLKQTGLFIVPNDSLRNQLSDLYACQYSAYHVFEKNYFFEHYSNYVKPMLMTEFETFEFYTSFKPINYSRFIKNQKYKPVVRYTADATNGFVFMLLRLKKSVENLILNVDQEIESHIIGKNG